MTAVADRQLITPVFYQLANITGNEFKGMIQSENEEGLGPICTL